MPWSGTKGKSVTASDGPVIPVAPPPAEVRSTKNTLVASHILDYDVLSIIFIMSMADWGNAPLTPSSICRHWRHAALATPQIWCRINFDAFINQEYIKICLGRSGLTPLHIAIPLLPTAYLLDDLRLITDRIICMKVTDSYRFLDNYFPILERLELLSSVQDLTEEERGRQCLSDTSRFPRLQELCILEAPDQLLGVIAIQPRGFRALQKLTIMCDRKRHWILIIDSVSSTLISLHLGVLYSPDHLTKLAFLPQLRHLQLTMHTHGPLELELDAPFLVSVDEGFESNRGDRVHLTLHHPQIVKELNAGNSPLNLTHYPGLRRLWIRESLTSHSNRSVIKALKAQIHNCPELESVMLYDSSEYRRRQIHEAQSTGTPIPNGLVFREISDVIRATGLSITLQEFVPSKLNLPGSIKRKNECLGSIC